MMQNAADTVHVFYGSKVITYCVVSTVNRQVATLELMLRRASD